MTLDDLEHVERCIRCYLVYDSLAISKVKGALTPLHSTGEAYRTDDYEVAFHDHNLDYDFIDTEAEHVVAPIEKKEQFYLENYIQQQIEEELSRDIPSELKTEGQLSEFVMQWYDGAPLRDALDSARHPMWDDIWGAKPMTKEQFLTEKGHPVFHLLTGEHGTYYLGCIKAGYGMCSSSPIVRYCNQHTFERWPLQLFETLDADFKVEMAAMLDPGLRFCIPLLTLLVLSRAANRDSIPDELVAMREEFKPHRRQLWKLLGELWLAQQVRDKIRIQRELKASADSIYAAAFPERFDALSLALEFAATTPSTFVSGMKRLREWDLPNSKVKAVSFAAKLSKELRENLLDQRLVMKRHLSGEERRYFGTS